MTDDIKPKDKLERLTTRYERGDAGMSATSRGPYLSRHLRP